MGRRVSSGADEAVSPTEFDAIAKSGTGTGTERVAQSALGRDVGRTTFDRHTRLPRQVYLPDDLTAAQLPRAYGHEIGHVIDQLAGEIPALPALAAIGLAPTVYQMSRQEAGT